MSLGEWEHNNNNNGIITNSNVGAIACNYV